AGIIGDFAYVAIVTAPRFNGASSVVRVPLGNIPTISPSLINFLGCLIELGPGFSRSTGNAFNPFINQFKNLVSNNSFFAILLIFVGSNYTPNHNMSTQPVCVQAST